MADEPDQKHNDESPEDRPRIPSGRVNADDDSDSAFSAQWFGNKVRVNNSTAQTLLKYAGPSLKWTVILMSVGGFVIMVCYGISMVVRR